MIKIKTQVIFMDIFPVELKYLWDTSNNIEVFDLDIQEENMRERKETEKQKKLLTNIH